MNPEFSDTPIPETENEQTSEAQPKKRNFFAFLLKLLFGATLLGALGILVAYGFAQELNKPPESFPSGTEIIIPEGVTAREITEMLVNQNVVRSESLLYYQLVLFHDPTAIKASTYVFDEPFTSAEVAAKLTEGDFDTDLVRFTHIEGERATQLAARAAETLSNFDTTRFIATAEPLEGHLYPDTYFIPTTFTDEDLLQLLTTTFAEKMEPLTFKIAEHPLSLEEILVLASIIEREANTKESKELVSSVLQNRMEIGMPLQADASIEYVLDKPLSELTPADLKVDTPYNTYLYPGLPPTPIGNPGLDAINAVLEPPETEYFYYITDDEGVFHFSETYDQHLRNIEMYLR